MIGNLVILVTIIILILILIIFFIFAFKKQKQKSLESLTRDLNLVNEKYQIKLINLKELPIDLKEIDNKEIYFCNKAVVGQYNYSQKVINPKNYNISKALKNNKINFFYHHYSLNFKRQKFIPLNKIDLLITKNEVILYHPLEPAEINLAKISNITFFWEKNPQIREKRYFPTVGFSDSNKHYFLLFQTYNEALKFIACINNISNYSDFS